jgi:hypothetical protein
MIRRSKTDQAGVGASAYLALDALRHLRAWLDAAGIGQGPLFRRVNRDNTVGERLGPDIVADMFKRVAVRIQLPADQIAKISGHSIRVGATQDLLALNIGLALVMQAGRWKSARMPIRYGEEVMAAKGRHGSSGGQPGPEVMFRNCAIQSLRWYDERRSGHHTGLHDLDTL